MKFPAKLIRARWFFSKNDAISIKINSKIAKSSKNVGFELILIVCIIPLAGYMRKEFGCPPIVISASLRYGIHIIRNSDF